LTVSLVVDVLVVVVVGDVVVVVVVVADEIATTAQQTSTDARVTEPANVVHRRMISG
jgi:hypothetical protein